MEKQQFKAESQRLLDLMINSIYTNREIFLRERYFSCFGKKSTQKKPTQGRR